MPALKPAVERLAVDHEGPLHLHEQLVGQFDRVARAVVQRLGDDDELVAAEPPSRSLSRRQPCRREAIWRSSSSPAAWPSVSLIVLNLSRSMNITATDQLLPRGQRERAAQRLGQRRAVHEAGERVVLGQRAQPRLETLALGELLLQRLACAGRRRGAARGSTAAVRAISTPVPIAADAQHALPPRGAATRRCPTAGSSARSSPRARPR